MRIIRPKRPIDDHTLVPIAFIQNTNISAEAKLVYLSAASHDQAGEPEPHRAVIMQETGLALHQVEAGIRDLEGISDDEWKRMGL